MNTAQTSPQALQTESTEVLIDELSGRLQKHCPPDVWRSLFEDRTGKARFGHATRTLVCVECPESGPLTRTGIVAALGRLAPRHHGLLDPCAGDFAIASFDEANDALSLAVAMQRFAPRARLRIGVNTCVCRMAACHCGDERFTVLLGAARTETEAMTSRASPGTIQLGPQAYVLLEEMIGEELGSCVVMAEYDGDVLTEVSLTLPPDRNTDLSTFAGLGLT